MQQIVQLVYIYLVAEAQVWKSQQKTGLSKQKIVYWLGFCCEDCVVVIEAHPKLIGIDNAASQMDESAL